MLHGYPQSSTQTEIPVDVGSTLHHFLHGRLPLYAMYTCMFPHHCHGYSAQVFPPRTLPPCHQGGALGSSGVPSR